MGKKVMVMNPAEGKEDRRGGRIIDAQYSLVIIYLNLDGACGILIILVDIENKFTKN